MAKQVRAVLDSNVVVDGFLNRRPASARIMRALLLGQFVAVGTLEVIAEYQLALRSQSVRAAANDAHLHSNLIHDYAQAVAEQIEVTPAGPSFRTSDESDDKFTAASSGGHADYIVSGDHSLLNLGEVLEARVVTPEEFEQVMVGGDG